MRWGQLLVASLLVALPVFIVPAFCFVLNRSAFMWSIAAVGITGWKLLRARRIGTAPDKPAKAPLSKLALATLLFQMLAFAWIGAVWTLQGLAQIATRFPIAGRTVGWVQGQWFAEIAAWLVLFAVVCGLFRLARPILAWHRDTIAHAARALLS